MILNIEGKVEYVFRIIKNYSNWWQVFVGRINRRPLKKINLRNGVTIEGGNKSLIIDLANEIFIDEVYNPNFLKIQKGDTVIDIGANIGVFSLYAAKNGASKVVSVEPLPENISLIVKNLENNGFERPKIFQKAISDKNGVEKLYLGDLDSHNLLAGKDLGKRFKKFINVETLTLAELLQKMNIKKIDFLKIDCEGAEGKIVESTGKEIWKKIDKIAIEYHNNVSTLNDKQIVKKLKSFGYKISTKKSDDVFGYIYAWR